MKPANIPAGAFGTRPTVLPAQNAHTLSIDTYLMASTGADKDVIQAIVRKIIEGKHELSLTDPAFMEISTIDQDESLVRVHPGLQAYLDRDKPSFLAAYIGEIHYFIAVLGAAQGLVLWLWGRHSRFFSKFIGVFRRKQASSHGES